MQINRNAVIADKLSISDRKTESVKTKIVITIIISLLFLYYLIIFLSFL